MIKDYFILAFKNLRKRGLRSWLTLLGIFIGVAAVIALISLGDGLQTAVNSQFGVSSTQLITVQAGGISGYGPPGSFVVNPLTEDDAEAIGKLSTVEIAIPRVIDTDHEIEFNDKTQTAVIGSIPPESASDIYELLDLKAQYGRMLYSGDKSKVVLGNNFADKDKSGFDKEVGVGESVIINGEKFRVIGIMKRKGSFILDGSILMLTDDLKGILNNGNDVDIIVAKVKDKSLMEQAKAQIEDLLRKRRNVKEGEEDFEVSTPEALLATVNQILSGVQMFIVLIASIAIIIGAIGIVNTMMTSVTERKKEIGIMKAIGARNSNIFLQFFVEAGMLGLIGGLAGVIAGSVVGFFGIMGINYFIGTESKPAIDLMLILATLTGSFIIGSISGIAPAMRAARQNPVEVLRD
jgi:putative ABC transport system permease protein